MSESHVIAPTAGDRACFDVTAEDVEGAHVDTRFGLPRALPPEPARSPAASA